MSNFIENIVAIRNVRSGKLLGLWKSSGLKFDISGAKGNVHYGNNGIPYAAVGIDEISNFKQTQNLWRVYKSLDGAIFENLKYKGVFLTFFPLGIPFLGVLARPAVGKTFGNIDKVPIIKLIPVNDSQRFNLQEAEGHYLSNSIPAGITTNDIYGSQHDYAGFSATANAQINPAFQWDIIEINRSKCCMGVTSDRSDQTICAEWWNRGFACDNYMNEYCSLNQTDSICSCLNSPIKKYNPLCVDGTCLRNSAYVSQNMLALPCPNVVDCSIVFDLNNVGRDTTFTDAQIKQACGTPDIKPVVPPSTNGGNIVDSLDSIWQNTTFLFIMFLLIWVIAFVLIYKYTYSKSSTGGYIEFEP